MISRIGILALSVGIFFTAGCASTVSKPEPEFPVETASSVKAESEQEMVTVTASRLNLRLDGTTQSRIIGVLRRGDTIAVLGRKSGWLNVQTGSGKQGWVAERYTHPEGLTPVGVLVQQSPPPATAAPVTTPAEAPSQAGAFTQEDAIALYNRHHKALAEGDLKTYFSYTPDPPDAEEMNQASPEELAQLKDMLLEVTPDLTKCELLKFDGSEQAAILVVRSDLDSADSITLTPLKFVTVEGEWRVAPGLYFDTLPRQDPQADKAAIARALETNPELQLAAVGADRKPSATGTPSAPLPPPDPVPDEPGKVRGEMVINGESTALKYAYAFSEPSFFDKTKTDTVVILSNMALDEEGVANWAKRSELEDIGKLHCIELTINADNKVISRRLRHAVFDGSPSGVSGLEVYEPLQADKETIAGKAYSTKESDIFGVKYQYRASFRARLRQPGQKSAKSKPKDSTSFKITPPSREDLTRVPRYVKDAVEPVFESPSAQEVLKEIKIVSDRSTAMFGFNTPEVVLYLPQIGNSAYAEVVFDDPVLFDGNGAPVPFELENGGYNGRTFSAEIRLAPKEGDGLVEFAMIKGSGKIRYPLKVDTRIVKAGDAAAKGPDVNLDGPFVTYTEPTTQAWSFSFSTNGPVRAYDASGRRLRQDGYSSSSWKNNVTHKTIAFRGNVAQFQMDTAGQWVEIEFNYELPPISPLPSSYSGRPSSRPADLADMPGGTVRKKLASGS